MKSFLNFFLLLVLSTFLACENQVTCPDNSQNIEGVCVCDEGYSGSLCEKQDLCVINEVICKNGGECNEGDCHCPYGFVGDSCSIFDNKTIQGTYKVLGFETWPDTVKYKLQGFVIVSPDRSLGYGDTNEYTLGKKLDDYRLGYSTSSEDYTEFTAVDFDKITVRIQMTIREKYQGMTWDVHTLNGNCTFHNDTIQMEGKIWMTRFAAVSRGGPKPQYSTSNNLIMKAVRISEDSDIGMID